MAKTAKPIFHGRDHAPDGPDPIPGLAGAAVVPYSISGDLDVANGGLRWYAPADGTISVIHASVGTAPSGDDITVRVNRNGTSLGSTVIANGEHTSSWAISSGYSAGDYFTVDVTGVGSSAPGADLVVQLRMGAA